MSAVFAAERSSDVSVQHSGWLRFTLRRTVRLATSLFVIISASFAMIHAIPGDPVRGALGFTASPTVVARIRHQLGLDRPLGTQYVSYLRHLVHGDLGSSLITGERVETVLAQELPATVRLAGTAFVLAALLGIPIGMSIGVLTQYGRHRVIDLGFAGITGVLTTLPDFVLAVLLQWGFAVSLRALPVAGSGSIGSYVLPVAALAIGPAALLARIARVETQRVLAEDYMRTARAKRLPRRLLYGRHVMPNMLAATLTVTGLIFASLLAGTVLVERIFAWPGIGDQLVSSVLTKDFPVVQALALVFGGAVLIVNFVVDLIIIAVDRRTVLRET
jgi:peptide/nickel transport system permease protein